MQRRRALRAIGLHRQLKLDSVVRRVDQILLRPAVPLGRLQRRMSEQQRVTAGMAYSEPRTLRGGFNEAAAE